MARIPTDLKILRVIYDRYYENFRAYSKKNGERSSKIYVPIDIGEIAKSLDVDADIVFGRLYYHLNEKFSYKHDDGSKVEFFALRVGDDPHCVNFPYLASILADLEGQNRKYLMTTILAGLSLLIAIISILISIFAWQVLTPGYHVCTSFESVAGPLLHYYSKC
jgi:hypothetical protein